ncbi:DUF11 domain-containing protein, partial [Enterococcus casseliflavus]|nr:DUF11 domain-containing protein [Enterococcus casseliflavus]
GEPDEPGEPQEPSVPVETPADISLEKTVDKASAQVGDTLTYTITANNAEGAGLWEGIIKDSIPTDYVSLVAGTTTVNGEEVSDDDVWTNGKDLAVSTTIASGEKTVIQFQVTVSEAALNQTIKNVATTDDGEETPPTETVVTPGPGKLESEKHVYDLDGKLLDDQEVKVGETIEYVITESNTAENTTVVNNIVITDNLPVGLDYVADSAYLTIDGEVVEDATINFADNTLTANVGTLKGGQTAELHFQATVNKEAKEGITNVATVDYTVPTT